MVKDPNLMTHLSNLQKSIFPVLNSVYYLAVFLLVAALLDVPRKYIYSTPQGHPYVLNIMNTKFLVLTRNVDQCQKQRIIQEFIHIFIITCCRLCGFHSTAYKAKCCSKCSLDPTGPEACL